MPKCSKFVHGENGENKQNEYGKRDDQNNELRNTCLRVIVYALIACLLTEFFCREYLLQSPYISASSLRRRHGIMMVTWVIGP
jgi:hypothetical protein